jgi:hypothetical protein
LPTKILGSFIASEIKFDANQQASIRYVLAEFRLEESLMKRTGLMLATALLLAAFVGVVHSPAQQLNAPKRDAPSPNLVLIPGAMRGIGSILVAPAAKDPGQLGLRRRVTSHNSGLALPVRGSRRLSGLRGSRLPMMTEAAYVRCSLH